MAAKQGLADKSEKALGKFLGGKGLRDYWAFSMIQLHLSGRSNT